MGGVQAKEEADVEVHSVRGGQLILRVAPQVTKFPSSSGGGPGDGAGTGGGGGGGSVGSTDHHNPRGLSKRESRLSLIIPYQGKCFILEQGMDVLEKIFQYLTPR